MTSNIEKIGLLTLIGGDPRLLHQTLYNAHYKGLPTTLQCEFNVNINQDLSIKKDDDYNNNLNNTINFKSKNLLNIKRYLKKYDLLNNKNLLIRKEIYYFSFYLEKDKNIQYSLKIKDFLLANIIKYKIILKLKEEIKRMNFEDEYLKQFNTSLTILKSDNDLATLNRT